MDQETGRHTSVRIFGRIHEIALVYPSDVHLDQSICSLMLKVVWTSLILVATDLCWSFSLINEWIRGLMPDPFYLINNNIMSPEVDKLNISRQHPPSYKSLSPRLHCVSWVPLMLPQAWPPRIQSISFPS